MRFIKWLALSIALLGLSTSGLPAQTELKPGFNLFSPEQDVEVGRQSAAEIEKMMPVIDRRDVQDYITRLGDRLARETPGPEFPYQFKVVNVADVNAFALPGGFMYIHRGLIEAADSEGELAGVMAHEIAHVALRHGTNQVSKAYLAQAGLGLLGAFLGGGGNTGQIVQAVGGFGLNATFLKFSRDAEKQADLLGTQILARAGYDPLEMASFFEELREMQGRDPGKFETFFSSHPPPADRSAHVQQEAAVLDVRVRNPVGGFEKVRSLLKQMPEAPSMQQLAEGGGTTGSAKPDAPVEVRIELPSARLVEYESSNRSFRIRYPANWRTAGEGDSVTIVPEGGVVQHSGQNQIVYGVIVDRFDPQGSGSPSGPFGGSNTLERSANLLTANILQSNPYLQADARSSRTTRVSGRQAVKTVLAGTSSVTGKTERVELWAVGWTGDTLLYCLFVAPEEDYSQLAWTFDNMIDTLEIVR